LLPPRDISGPDGLGDLPFEGSSLLALLELSPFIFGSSLLCFLEPSEDFRKAGLSLPKESELARAANSSATVKAISSDLNLLRVLKAELAISDNGLRGASGKDLGVGASASQPHKMSFSSGALAFLEGSFARLRDISVAAS